MPGLQSDRLIQITDCEVCGATQLSHVLDLGHHPLCDDLIAVGDERRAVEYPISLSYCDTCHTVHQEYQVPNKLLFPTTYHYRARHTKDVLDGMRQLVERCETQLGSLKGLSVIDIGCNDGSLLSIFEEFGATTIGIEPTGAAADARAAGHTVYEDYLAPDLAKQVALKQGKPNIITFTNVFAHIENLAEVIESLRALLDNKTLVVIENHYLGAILDKHQFDTFYHEHPRTYSNKSFEFIAASLGARIAATEFPSRYGGNIRVLMQNKDTASFNGNMPVEDNFKERLQAMNDRIPRWQKVKRAEIEKLIEKHGRLPAKAFPGRAAILIKLLGLDENMISAVYEKPGSMKIGHYVPGTRIPILSDDDFSDNVAPNIPLMNFAWHISSEINAYLRKQGFGGDIYDIFSSAEFEAA